MTTIRTEGLSRQDGDVRQYGMSNEGLIARQVMLGVLQTADGLPLYHEIFEGNTAEEAHHRQDRAALPRQTHHRCG